MMKGCRVPHYNHSIIEDMFMDEHIKYLRSAAETAEYYEDVSILLKVWAAKRVTAVLLMASTVSCCL